MHDKIEFYSFTEINLGILIARLTYNYINFSWYSTMRWDFYLTAAELPHVGQNGGLWWGVWFVGVGSVPQFNVTHSSPGYNPIQISKPSTTCKPGVDILSQLIIELTTKISNLVELINFLSLEHIFTPRILKNLTFFKHFKCGLTRAAMQSCWEEAEMWFVQSDTKFRWFRQSW